MDNSFRRHWAINWPFLSGVGSTLLIIAVLFGWAAINQNAPEWWLVSILAMILLSLFILIQTWFFLQTERAILKQLPRWFVRRGRISTEDQILFPYVSDSRIVPLLIQHLTTGKVWLVDIYSPADMQNQITRRKRDADSPIEKDPRIKPIPGDMTLLPIQDGEIDVVILFDVLQSITQEGDRERFLTEISRVMKPNARILFFESGNLPARILADPAASVRFWNKSQINKALQVKGFSRIEIQTPSGLTILGRAATPGRYENTQLPLEF